MFAFAVTALFVLVTLVLHLRYKSIVLDFGACVWQSQTLFPPLVWLARALPNTLQAVGTSRNMDGAGETEMQIERDGIDAANRLVLAILRMS